MFGYDILFEFSNRAYCNRFTRLQARLLKRFFKICFELKLSVINGMIIMLYTKVYTRVILKNVKCEKKKKYRVIAFSRPLFENDLIEIYKRTEIDVLFMPNIIWTTLFRSFLPGEFRCQIKYHLFRSTQALNLKHSMRRACEKVVRYLAKFHGVKGLVFANVDYGWDQEWMNACRSLSIPTVVIDKEGAVLSESIIDGMQRHWKNIAFRFPGNKVAVFSAKMKKLVTEAGVANERQVFVTGMPRTDSVFYASQVKQRRWIVLFSFYYHAVKRSSVAKYHPREMLWDETIRCIVEQAKKWQHSGYGLFIKTKDVFDTRDVKDYLEKCDLAGNVRIDHDISFEELVLNTKVFCGYKSSALIQVMASQIPIIIVNWAEAETNVDENMFKEHKRKSAYEVAWSHDDFEEKVARFLSKEPFSEDELVKMRKERDEMIEDILYKIDGQCSQRAADVIKGAIDEIAFQR